MRGLTWGLCSWGIVEHAAARELAPWPLRRQGKDCGQMPRAFLGGSIAHKKTKKEKQSTHKKTNTVPSPQNSTPGTCLGGMEPKGLCQSTWSTCRASTRSPPGCCEGLCLVHPVHGNANLGHWTPRKKGCFHAIATAGQTNRIV